MSSEKVLLHCSNPTCERWKQFFEPLTLDGLPLTCGLCGHKLVPYEAGMETTTKGKAEGGRGA